jgi:hypothetical protein
MNNANRILTNPNPTVNIVAEAIGQLQVLRDNTLADFTEALRNAENQTNETFTEMDPKYLHQFVQNFRLHYWLNGKNVAQLAQLANKSSADDEQGQWIVSMGIQC